MKRRNVKRECVILITLIMVLSVIGIDAEHWTFLRTEEFSIGGMFVCLGWAGIRSRW